MSMKLQNVVDWHTPDLVALVVNRVPASDLRSVSLVGRHWNQAARLRASVMIQRFYRAQRDSNKALHQEFESDARFEELFKRNTSSIRFNEILESEGRDSAMRWLVCDTIKNLSHRTLGTTLDYMDAPSIAKSVRRPENRVLIRVLCCIVSTHAGRVSLTRDPAMINWRLIHCGYGSRDDYGHVSALVRNGVLRPSLRNAVEFELQVMNDQTYIVVESHEVEDWIERPVLKHEPVSYSAICAFRRLIPRETPRETFLDQYWREGDMTTVRRHLEEHLYDVLHEEYYRNFHEDAVIFGSFVLTRSFVRGLPAWAADRIRENVPF